MATELMKLALDVYENRVQGNFSKKDGEEAIRKAIKEAVGGEWNYYNFKKNRYDVYAIISEVLTLPVQASVEGLFNGLVGVEQVALGDKKVFEVENTDLFKVAKVAKGNSDIRRQRIFNNEVEISTDNLAIKIYEDFDKFIAGRVDFAKLVDKVNKSIANDTAVKIADAIFGSYSKLSATYGVKGSYDESKMDDIIAHVEAKTGMRVALYGTKKALGKVTSAIVADSQKETYSALGHYGSYKGTEMITLPQVHENGTDTFALPSDIVLVLPVGLEIAKVVYEGEPIVDDTQDFTKRNDRQIEFLVSYSMGLAVLVANYFGMYDID